MRYSSRHPFLVLMTAACIGSLGMMLCEIIEVLVLFPGLTRLQVQISVFAPLFLLWFRLEHLTE